MKIMVAFLGKKNNLNKISNIKKINILQNRNKKNTKTSIKNISKVTDNRHKSRIYANVVSNQTIIAKKSNLKINKDKALNNIEDILKNKENSKLKFNSINTNNNLGGLRLIFFMLVVVLISAIALNNTMLLNNVLIKFSTNFRQAENFNFEVADLVKKYGLYNTNNYIINQEIEKKIEEAQVNMVSNDESIIDKEAQIDDIATFFGNEKVNVEITENSNSIQRITIGSTRILNYSSKRNIDYADLLSTDVIFTKKSDKILLYNTHTSESYTNSEGYKFEYTGIMRTTDANFNMLAISKKLNENLKAKGFESFQDTTPHDYGTYTSAYAKSRITVKKALESMSGAGIIIDVHRDASSDLSFRPVANIKGVQVAQLMFVVGVGSNATPNDNWKDNLKLALKLQQIADKVYPGLFRPMIIRNSVYNQDLNKYSLLIEFGATGNTIEEVNLSTRCITNLLNILYKD